MLSDVYFKAAAPLLLLFWSTPFQVWPGTSLSSSDSSAGARRLNEDQREQAEQRLLCISPKITSRMLCLLLTDRSAERQQRLYVAKQAYFFSGADAAKTISLTSEVIPAGSLVHFLHYWWGNEKQEWGGSSLSQPFLTLISSNTESFPAAANNKVQKLALKYQAAQK